MPLQNRVTPLGELLTHPGRGLVYGNRGCLHDEQGRIRRRWATKRWIACRLEFRGWHREPLMQPGKFTELFFLDEATAFAAGLREDAARTRAAREACAQAGQEGREKDRGRCGRAGRGARVLRASRRRARARSTRRARRAGGRGLERQRAGPSPPSVTPRSRRGPRAAPGAA